MILRILCCAILQFCIIGYVFGVVPQITRLNVQCDRTGMKVNVEFDNPFNGIIFSKGHYSDPNCRWVSASSARRQFNFYVGTSKCGTIGTDMSAGSTSPQGFKNVIIIQNDPDYQEVWDSARKLSCDWVTRLEKYVTFAPFGVDMLGVKELRFPGDSVDCWMDIQRGHGPFAPSVGGVVPIGEKLTVVIYVRDTDSSFDVHVKDCYAYDSSDYRNPNARAIKLTDENGCPVKEKLVQGFYRTRDVRTSGATIISYGIINAFKFPERMDVFLACNVEVCKGTCPNNDCQPEVAVAGTGETPAGVASSTAAPSTDEDKDEDKEQETTDDEKPTGDESTSSTTEATETDGDDEKTTEESTDSGSGTATEESESSEDTSEKPKPEGEEDKEEESKDEESKDEESKDEEKKDEGSKDEEKKEDEKEESNDVEDEKTEEKDEEKKDDEEKDEEKTESTSEKTDAAEGESKDEETKKDDADEDKEQTKEDSKDSAKDDEDEEESRRKAAKIKLQVKNKKSGRKSKSNKKADVILPRKRSVKRPSRKNTTPTPTLANKPKAAKLKAKSKAKSSKGKPKSKSSTLKASPSTVRAKRVKSSNTNANMRARIIRAPSSIPAAFSRQRRERNMAFEDLYQREGRHIRSRRSVTVLSENATFPAMMHSISIISPIEDLDEKELNAWEKMIDLEGKAEEVSLLEAITKLPTLSAEGSYCFSMPSLVSASVLLAAVVMVLSMSVAMVCMHLRSRSSIASKSADLY